MFTDREIERKMKIPLCSEINLFDIFKVVQKKYYIKDWINQKITYIYYINALNNDKIKRSLRIHYVQWAMEVYLVEKEILYSELIGRYCCRGENKILLSGRDGFNIDDTFINFSINSQLWTELLRTKFFFNIVTTFWNIFSITKKVFEKRWKLLKQIIEVEFQGNISDTIDDYKIIQDLDGIKELLSLIIFDQL